MRDTYLPGKSGGRYNATYFLRMLSNEGPTQTARHLITSSQPSDGRRHCGTTPTYPLVTVDGPTRSPPRYGETRLCMWHPDDPPSEKWQFDDGLLALLGLTSAHMFREAWLRETGEWAGPEAPHGELKDEDVSTLMAFLITPPVPLLAAASQPT